MALLDYESGTTVCECGAWLAEDAQKCTRCGKVVTTKAAWIGLWAAVAIAVLGMVAVIYAVTRG